MIDFVDHPVFICGHPKAGTSLITSLLDGHPAIVAYPEETLFFRRFLPAIAGKSFDERSKLADELLLHIFEWDRENPPEHQLNYPDRDYSDIDASAVREEFQAALAQGELNKRAYLDAAVYAFGKATGILIPETRLWVEKTPYNEFYSDDIFNWWPEAKCIHIVRNPRDNYVSYQRKQPGWTVKKFAWNWIRSTNDGIKNREKYGSERYLVIRFEDLLNDPETITYQVAEFLGIPWHEAMLQPTRVGESWRGNSMFDQKFRQISKAPIGRWQGAISPVDLALLQMIAKPEMEAMGYPLVTPDLHNVKFSSRVELVIERAVTYLKRFKLESRKST